MKTVCEVFSNNLKEILKKRSLSQSSLAKLVGVNSSSVVHWCVGRSLPNAAMIDAICKELGVTLSDLFSANNSITNEKISLKSALDLVANELGFEVKPLKKTSKRRKVNTLPRILFVDDNKGFCEEVLEFLTAEGFFIKTVFDGKAALKLIEKEQFDIVISDNAMPEISGLRLMKILLEEHPQIRRIFASGTAADSEMMLLYPHAILQKPYKKQQLLDAIKNVWMSHIAELKEAR
jgi:CheY-like chemotaxis protein